MLQKVFLTLLLTSSSLFAFNPVVLLEVENKNIDKTSFVGLGHKAVDSFQNLYNHKVPIFSSHGNKYDKEQLIRDVLAKGYDPIISLGFLFSKPLQNVAKDFPDKTFIIIEGDSEETKNILNITFKEEEGSFLVGAIAALKSKTDIIGFVGGMDIPVIRRFGCGYIQGIKYINPDAKVLVEMTGDDYLAFNNPKKGKEITQKMIKQGADVIFHAADMTGSGVIEAAKENGVFAIGVDANQNGEAPGAVLTSMLKRIDVAMYKILIDSFNKQLATNDLRLGIKEEAISWALDKYNINLIDKKMQNKIDAIEFDIVEEIIEIEDYMKHNKCSSYNFEAKNDTK